MKVKIENLSKKFNNFTAIDNLNVEFNDGELICLLGPSGCGKSTMLYLISGILEGTKGKIFFDDEDITNIPPEKRNIGLVFQNYSLYPHMSVERNIGFPLEIKKISKKERTKKINELANLVHIDSMLHRKPKELSGGQQQRVAIARALAKEPRILLLDEPLSNLDAKLRIEMREEIRNIQKSTNITAIFVTHDQEEAMTISDKILLMDKGVVQQYSTPEELYNNPNNLFVAGFIGNPSINKIHGKVENNYLITDGNIKIKYDFPKEINNKDVILGIRPESISLTEGDDYNISAKIQNFYTLGREKLIDLSIDDIKIKITVPSSVTVKKDEVVKLLFKHPGIFIFDPKDGSRIK
ncbi:ABC transporter ATP-binding protein [Clostridium cadaveris]|uniref:ABC transporter ATP-binding protein n=1 Tax=Clostridium cadaveris TaxID=1529 RepID=UPI000C07A959|nr:ABC transporter ATP-binding protein [Clostridium cadaveris]